VEQLNKNIKEDKTQIGLRFIEKGLQTWRNIQKGKRFEASCLKK
jgi:hypothetical protein